ncbi:response regulator [Maribellus sp. YY47]|uniref:hybrid sensor histidine kinase/response regulator transcription factor n=1 Tax=Maribellus sp. YY47 TaxID=2929486 RepID=UPI0020015543|nr:response regulator [Maribellus sp. YY47]MCK3683613.1 response regulator [Maribellus sp. YY47]
MRTTIRSASYFLIVCTIAFFCFAGDILAQEIRFDHFDTRKGLSQNNINALIVDSAGFVWIGTIEGISRFDGNNFDIFRSSPTTTNTLESNYIQQLSSCPNGNIWVHMLTRGLNLYDAASEEFRSFPDSVFLPADIINTTSIVSPKNEVLWFTDPKGLYCFTQGNTGAKSFKVPFSYGHIIKGKGENVLYWGSRGIYSYQTSDTTLGRKIIDSRVYSISEIYNDSLVLINTGQKIEVLNLITFQTKPIPTNEKTRQILGKSSITCVAGYDNEIWAGLSDGLVLIKCIKDSIFSVKKYSYDPFNNYSFHGKDAKNLMFDKAGNLWIGTSKYGVNLYCRRKNQFNHHQISALSKADQEIDPIRAICKTSDSNIWVGFDRLGIVCTHPDGKQVLYSEIQFPGKQKRSLENIRSLYEDSEGILWIGTNSGLCKYNSQLNRIESVTVEYNWEWPDVCYFMKEFDPGKLTVTSPFGIGIIDLKTKNFQRLKMPPNYRRESMRSLALDKNGNYWFISADLGLCKFKPGEDIKYFTYKKAKLTDNKLYSLELLGDTIWIGSNNGLMAFDIEKEQVVARFFEKDGLSNNLVYSTIYSNGYLWMSTNRGISRLRMNDFYIEKFLTDDVFMDDAYFQDKEGNIFLGGFDGFVSFNPKLIQDDQTPPDPVITALYINNTKVTVNNEEKTSDTPILTASIQNTNSLRLYYSSNSFSLSFDAFPFNYPDLTYFRYRLIGLSPNWIVTPQNANRGIFTNLSPGEYTFEVQASQNGQIWSPVKQLAISIIPPFYKTLWFKWIVALTIVLIIVAIFRIRLYTIKQWNIQLETQIKEQTLSIEEQKNKIIDQKEKMVELNKRLREADQAKLKYYTNLSHEFRTPLTIIMGNIETLREQGVNQFILKNINRSSDRLFRLVNQFIDLRKYDQGELKLRISNFDIVSFTKDISDSFKDLALRKNIHLEFPNNIEKAFLWLDRDKTDKIIYNILSNALKYTEENGSVFIDFLKQDYEFALRITDTGVGIPESEQPNIFNRFYRSEKISAHIDGHGMGLSLVKALVDMQQARIEYTSEEGVGTSFSVFFKYGNKHFSKADIYEDTIVQEVLETEYSEPVVIESGNPSGDEILVVEDNPELLEYLSSLLGKHFKIQTATNGKEALLKLEQNTPDLVLTDLMMPVMDGLELSKTIRENAETRFIPIIILSAKTDVTTKIEGFQLNIDDYIDKPFNPKLLLSRIRNILNKQHQIRNDAEQFIMIKSNGWSKEDKLFFKKILIILDRHYSDPEFNSDTLSTMVGMSRVTFYRKMKKLEYESPGEFIRKYRLKKAASLIKEGNKTVNEICNEVGFQSLSHFRKSFKEEYKVLPSKFQ